MVDPNSWQAALRTHLKHVRTTCRSVGVISYTSRTQHPSHCSHRSHWGTRGDSNHRSHLSYPSSLRGTVSFDREEESFALIDRRCRSVGCPYPRSVRNTSSTLWPRWYEGSRLECYRLIVVENGIQIVATPGLIPCCDKSVITIR